MVKQPGMKSADQTCEQNQPASDTKPEKFIGVLNKPATPSSLNFIIRMSGIHK